MPTLSKPELESLRIKCNKAGIVPLRLAEKLTILQLIGFYEEEMEKLEDEKYPDPERPDPEDDS